MDGGVRGGLQRYRRELGGLTLRAPQLAFACELDPVRLAELFSDPVVVDDLLALNARVALMCSDYSDERAAVVRRLNAAGVPVTGIPLLPLAEGYYFTTDNVGQAAGSYQEFTAWTRRHELAWDALASISSRTAASSCRSGTARGGWCRCWYRGCWTGPGRPGRRPPTVSWWHGSAPTAGRWRTISSR
jgi:hypothetical protein